MRQIVALGSEETELELGGTVEEVTVTLVERMARWPAQWREEGRREGMSEEARRGRRGPKGVAGVAGRSGDVVGRRVEAVLEDIEDWDGPELLDGVSRMAGPSG